MKTKYIWNLAKRKYNKWTEDGCIFNRRIGEETGKKNNTDEWAGTENQTRIKELEGTEDHASTKVQAGTED